MMVMIVIIMMIRSKDQIKFGINDRLRSTKMISYDDYDEDANVIIRCQNKIEIQIIDRSRSSRIIQLIRWR